MMSELSQDQYRFLVANAAGLSLALPYRYVPKSMRNEFNFIPGILMVYYCFGRQANSLVLFAVVSYAVCRLIPRHHVQRVTMCSALAFLSYAHLSRQIIDYGGYVLDISGPFMIAVQKITSLGFCLHDGEIKKLNESKSNKEEVGEPEKGYDSQSREQGELNMTQDSRNNNATNDDDNSNNNNNYIRNRNRTNCDESDKEDMVRSAESTGSTASVIGSSSNLTKNRPQMDEHKLTEEQDRLAVSKMPSFKEFMGYFFHFPSVLCGPIMYFNEYSEFVETPQNKTLPPGRFFATAKKLTISASCAILHLTLSPKFEIEFLRSSEFLIKTPILIRFYYILIFTMLSRLKYYVAWHLGEATSNLSGLGFNGYGADGKPRWNLISNMELLKFETCLSMRDAILAWNKTTQSWLRRTAYERAPRKLSVVATYMLSAIWHGFYPGYYMTFLGGALFTHAARNGRRFVRPLFQRGKILPRLYDAITFILTRLTIAYVAFPFVILDFRNNFEIYKSLYFSIHILALGGVLLGYVCRK